MGDAECKSAIISSYLCRNSYKYEAELALCIINKP